MLDAEAGQQLAQERGGKAAAGGAALAAAPSNAPQAEPPGLPCFLTPLLHVLLQAEDSSRIMVAAVGSCSLGCQVEFLRPAWCLHAAMPSSCSEAKP